MRQKLTIQTNFKANPKRTDARLGTRVVANGKRTAHVYFEESDTPWIETSNVIRLRQLNQVDIIPARIKRLGANNLRKASFQITTRVSQLSTPVKLHCDGHKMNLNESIVVAGAHRSGTTVIGDILCSKRSSIELYEPFNIDSGIKGLKYWYINADLGKNSEKDIIDDFMNGRAHFRHFGIKEGLSRLIRRENIRLYTATSWKYKAIFTFPNFMVNRIVIKDPFLTYSARSLIKKYKCKFVFVVKHPCAYYISLLRMGWHDSTPLASLLGQGLLSEEEVARANSPVKQTALFWNTINSHVASVVADYPLNATYIYHDEFCLSPAEVFSSALKDIGLTVTREELARLSLRTSGSTIVPSDKTLHLLNRRTKDMPNAWQKHLSTEDERFLMNNCGSVLRHFVS